MSKNILPATQRDNSILFFIIVFLLLFYDNSALVNRIPYLRGETREHDSSIMFFILVFLLLFY